MTAELARAGGPIGCAGLALVLLATRRDLRLVGLGLLTLGALFLLAYLAPTGHRPLLAAAGVVGLVVAVGGAWLFLRWPWLVPIAALVCVPARIPVKLGSESANLLIPLYGVVVAAGLAFAWRLIRGDERARELGPLAWPLAAFVAWSGLSLAWSQDLRQGAITLLFFFLPFGLLAVVVARLPWSRRWLEGVYGLLGVMAVVFAFVGLYQWVNRDVFWNPKVIVANAYAPSGFFYRVNSVFYDPSIYGRFLVLAILASLVIVLYSKRPKIAISITVVIVATWVGLFFSFSQSSFVTLVVGVLAAAGFAWRRRAVGATVLAGALLLAVGVTNVGMAAPSGGLNRATSDRYKLITNGIRIALAHPVQGVGIGGFKNAYADRYHLKGKEPKKAASHDTPVTVAAEEGLPGLLLLGWLFVAGILAAWRGVSSSFRGQTKLILGLLFGAIAVHSLFYNAFFEDPMMWGILGLSRWSSSQTPGGAGVIGAWERALVLAPHTDDGEFGCGGTMTRLVDAGADVRYVAFSIATKSLPEGFPPDTLAKEVREATAEIGIPADNLTVHDFEVRTFPEHRQEILELLIELWEEWKPDAVLQPRPPTTSTRITRSSPRRACARSSGRPSSATRFPGTTSTSTTRRTCRSRSHTWSGRSPPSRSTPPSSTGATPIRSTSGTSRARTGST